MFSGFIGESMAQTPLMLLLAAFAMPLPLLLLVHCLLYYMPRAQCFSSPFYSYSQFCPYILLLSKLNFVRVCVCVLAHTIKIYTPTHFSPLPKKNSQNKNRFSLDTNAHKQKIGRFFSLHRFISAFFFYSLFVVIMLCNSSAMYVLVYVLCDLGNEIRLFLLRRFTLYIEHLHILH